MCDGGIALSGAVIRHYLISEVHVPNTRRIIGRQMLLLRLSPSDCVMLLFTTLADRTRPLPIPLS